jgi:uncharacterized protein
MTQQARRHKHVPLRTCVVCRQKFEKRALIRLVDTGDGVVIDSSGKMAGRGAYLCTNKTCWDRALSSGILDRALQTVLTDQDRTRLLQAIT